MCGSEPGTSGSIRSGEEEAAGMSTFSFSSSFCESGACRRERGGGNDPTLPPIVHVLIVSSSLRPSQSHPPFVSNDSKVLVVTLEAMCFSFLQPLHVQNTKRHKNIHVYMN